MKNIYLAICIALIALSGCSKQDKAISAMDTFIATQKIDTKDPKWKTTLSKPEQLTFSENKRYIWELTTNQGSLTIELFHEVAPMHVTSTIYLTKIGFYDNLTFHRVIPGFMAQGGDPLGNGTGSPGYYYSGEFNKENARAKHDRPGILSMANRGPETDGSQFFLTFGPTPHLNGRHTVFGEVIAGLEDVLPKIEKLGSRRGKTKEDVIVLTASIRVLDK